MRGSVKHALVASFGFSVLLIVGLVAYHAVALQTLGRLYQRTLKRSSDMEVATDAQHIGEDLYLVIANAVINRDLVASARLWDAAKRDNLAKLQKVADSADIPEEIARVKQAREAFDDIVAIYEQELLPLVQKGGSLAGPIADIDARIDARVVDIDTALQRVAKMESDEDQVAAGEFRAVLIRTNGLGLIVSLIAIGVALSSFAVTTRLISRPIAEMTRAATEVGKGNYLVELTHGSTDETEALEDAFKSMLVEVKGRTAEMERANEQLLLEVGDRKRRSAELQLAYDELQAASRVLAIARDARIGERMSNEDLEEMAAVLKMTRSATNARQCGLRILAEARRAREAEAGLMA